MKKGFIVSLAIFASSYSIADEQFYFGVGGQLGSYEQSNTAGFDGADFTALQVTFGAYISGNHAFEIRLTKGISGKEFTYSGDEQTLEVSDARSFFYRYDLGLTENINLYPLVGYTDAEFDVDFSDSSYTDYSIASRSGFSYGLGLNANISENVKVYAEYIDYFSDDVSSTTIDYTGFSAGVNFLLD